MTVGRAQAGRSSRQIDPASLGPTRRPSKRGSLSAGLSFSAASFVGTTTVALFTSIFIARLYGIRVVGAFALVMAPVAAVTLLSTVREQPALQREVAILPPRHPRVTGLFLAVLGFSSGLTFVIAAIAIIAVYVVFHGPVHHPALFMPAVASLAGYALRRGARDYGGSARGPPDRVVARSASHPGAPPAPARGSRDGTGDMGCSRNVLVPVAVREVRAVPVERTVGVEAGVWNLLDGRAADLRCSAVYSCSEVVPPF